MSGAFAASKRLLLKLKEPWYVLTVAAALLLLAAVELSKDLAGLRTAAGVLRYCAGGEDFFNFHSFLPDGYLYFRSFFLELEKTYWLPWILALLL